MGDQPAHLNFYQISFMLRPFFFVVLSYFVFGPWLTHIFTTYFWWPMHSFQFWLRKQPCLLVDSCCSKPYPYLKGFNMGCITQLEVCEQQENVTYFAKSSRPQTPCCCQLQLAYIPKVSLQSKTAAPAPAITSAFQPPKRLRVKEIRLKYMHQPFLKHCLLIFPVMFSIFATYECSFLLISQSNSLSFL